MDHITLITIAAIGLLAFSSQWIAWWLKVPAILFLLLFGILAGPALHLINPQHLFGELLDPVIKISVAIILFEGSLTLNFKELHGVGKAVRNLVTIGPIITATISAYSMYKIFQLPMTVCALFGAIICVSGPTVVVPMLRSIRPKQHIANILRWEGILIDPTGAILAVITLGVIGALHNSSSFYYLLMHLLGSFLAAGAISTLCSYGLGKALRQRWIPEYLHNIATLSLVIAAYTISNLVDESSGLLCVTLMGVFLSNMPGVHIDDILDFKENLSIMLISGVFIIIAAQVKFNYLYSIIFPAALLFFALQFVVRPITVFLCTINTDLNIKEKILISWVYPRGIVAAAVAPFFAIRLSEMGVHGANLLVLITFLMIIATVIFQSLTSKYVANFLSLSEPEPKGFLIIGANPVARILAKALEEHNYYSILSDSSWSNISKAKMDNLRTFYGNAVSEHADRHLNLIGIGNMVAATPSANINSLAVLRYKSEFGRDHVFSLQTGQASQRIEKHDIAERLLGTQLFDEELSFNQFASLIDNGATIKSTKITENFQYGEYVSSQENNIFPLFAIDNKERIHFFTQNSTPEIAAGWIIVSLLSTGY